MSESALPSHRKVRVDLGARGYDVEIGRGLLQHVGRLTYDVLSDAGYPAIIADEELKSYIRIVLESLTRPPFRIHKRILEKPSHYLVASDYEVKVADLAAGESAKSLKEYAQIVSDLAADKVPRTAVIFGLGGGVIGDLAGFVAATYLRGVNFVQVPTTLLAMVDSSVGGKTGVNLPEGKNLVGAFHQPKLVVADLDTLATLPAREFAAGMAEVIKYGAIRDAKLFRRVMGGVKPDDADLDEIVETCVAIKARIVERDEFETKGERALLNFGHTIGHAIEKATNYTAYLHGEAIALGMRAAAWLSRREGGLSQEAARDLDLALIANQLPVVLKPEVDSQAILAALGNDKKVAADGGNRWVLLSGIGQAESGRIVSPEMAAQAVEYLRTRPDDL
jgi:3-dehydroquinate synthase